MVRFVILGLAVLLAGASGAQAREWARKMFKVTSHDFGHVARGAKAEVAFTIQNLYEEDVHIADVRTSCGCTTPTITKPTLKSLETGSIIATFNTKSYLGQRHSTLTVIIDKPYYAEVPITIAGYVHGEVDFQPGAVSFGDVSEGSPAEQSVTVTYRGRQAWQVTDVRSLNTNLEVELSDPMRVQGQIAYKMTVRLKEGMPAGTIHDQLTLVTNDPRMPTVALTVEGRIVPPLSVSPSPLFFGTLQPGQMATKQLVLTGKQPFKVTGIHCDLEMLEFKTAANVEKKVHLIPATITAGDKPGDFECTIEIETNLPSGGKAVCKVRGTVAEDSAANTAVGSASNVR
jgi:hypothetical protein